MSPDEKKEIHTLYIERVIQTLLSDASVERRKPPSFSRLSWGRLEEKKRCRPKEQRGIQGASMCIHNHCNGDILLLVLLVVPVWNGTKEEEDLVAGKKISLQEKISIVSGNHRKAPTMTKIACVSLSCSNE
mmetsp:Transcript_19713/g.33671  ORF Transcript_19713/g.33671 Transcript_19713/m.33671 type:complete len:131 (-) Transcript_19713:382-774(-)